MSWGFSKYDKYKAHRQEHKDPGTIPELKDTQKWGLGQLSGQNSLVPL